MHPFLSKNLQTPHRYRSFVQEHKTAQGVISITAENTKTNLQAGCKVLLLPSRLLCS